MKIEHDHEIHPSTETGQEWLGSPKKAYEIACMAIEAFEEIGSSPSRARLEAVLFLADVEHLGLYGRTLYGESWTVGWSGPIPAILSSILDLEPRTLDLIPSDIVNHVRRSEGVFQYMFRACNRRRVSDSDMEAVNTALAQVVAMSPCELMRTMRHHRVLARPVGSRVPIVEMLDATDPLHEERCARLAEEAPYIAF